MLFSLKETKTEELFHSNNVFQWQQGSSPVIGAAHSVLVSMLLCILSAPVPNEENMNKKLSDSRVLNAFIYTHLRRGSQNTLTLASIMLSVRLNKV